MSQPEKIPEPWNSFFSALDRYDLAVSKLERNDQRVRDDVEHLASSVAFDLEILKQRYEKELRWRLGNPEREDLKLKLWMEMFAEDRILRS
jgi:archaellum component FlaC